MSALPQKLGKYQIKSVLGQGAMGIVYQGFDPDIERTVAIKVLHPHLVDTHEGQSLKERFRREAQAAAKCFHPNIVAVFELGHDAGRDFIAMEYVQGEELKYFIDHDNNFTRAESSLIIIEVLKALAAAHSNGVVHRDIKPANVILLDDGNVKVADFGVARLEQSDLTMAGNMVGTPSYMSPEGLRGESVDAQADLYSTAMVLLELITGRKPNPQELYAKPVSEFLNQVFAEHVGEPISIAIEKLIRKGLSQNKQDRFDSAHDFIQAIKEAFSDVNPDHQDTINQLSETVISQKPLYKETVEQSVEWDTDVLKKLEQGLASYIGPLASVLVKKSSTSNMTPEELIQSLASNLNDPDEKRAFLNKAKQYILAGCTHDSAVVGGQSTVADRLSMDQLSSISKKLAFYLGPLATPLVKREAKKQVDLTIFYEALADKISDAEEKKSFLKMFDL